MCHSPPRLFPLPEARMTFRSATLLAENGVLRYILSADAKLSSAAPSTGAYFAYSHSAKILIPQTV